MQNENVTKNKTAEVLHSAKLLRFFNNNFFQLNPTQPTFINTTTNFFNIKNSHSFTGQNGSCDNIAVYPFIFYEKINV